MDNRTLIHPAGQSAGERTLVTSSAPPPTDAGVRTQMGVAFTCPVCQTQNAWGTDWCGECGFKLDATPGSSPSPDTLTPPAQLTDEKGKVYPLHAGVNTVGRQDAMVLLQDPTVSRQHAQIGIEETGCWVEDLGSSNGTKVNGQRLNAGARIGIGEGASLLFGNVSLKLQVHRLPADPSNQSATEDAEEEVVDTGAIQDNAASASFGVAEEALTSPGDMASESDTLPAASDTGVEPGPRLLLPSGAAFDIPEGTSSVGRRDANNVVIPDSYTSGHHAQLVREGQAVFVVDQNSTNGTQLNGIRLPPGERSPLQDGDVLTFGQTQVIFFSPEEP